MKPSELREKNINELRELLVTQAKQQFKMRMAKGLSEGASKSQAGKLLRRGIARIHTIINEKERHA